VQGKVSSARGLRRGLLVTTLVLGVALLAGPSVADPGQNEVSINDVAVVEGDTPGTVNAIFTVTLNPPDADSQTTVNYSTSDGSATGGSDYTSDSDAVVFAIDDTEQTISIPVLGDDTDEIDETFDLDLTSSDADIATGDAGTGTATISDDDDAPTISITDVSVAEGNSGTKDFDFTVALSNPSSNVVTVQYQTGGGNASAGSDYVAEGASTLTFNPGEALSQTVDVAVNGDTTAEPNETFDVTLSNATNASISTSNGVGVGTIQNDDAAPTISINDISLNEGNTGTATFGFTVSLSNASSSAVSVQYQTGGGTATTGSDYVGIGPPPATLTFNPGDPITKPVNVAVNGDTTAEPNETFNVTLANPANATISPGNGVGTGTIQNDDAAPSVSINDISLNEGNTGTTNLGFTVSLSNASSSVVTVQYQTGGGSATAGTDYVAHPLTTLTFNPGDPLTKPVNVTVNGDTTAEPNETFNVTLSNPTNATISPGNGVGTGTIQDEDPDPTVSINDASVAEGNSGTKQITFNVTLSAASGKTVMVNYATANGVPPDGAVTPGDYAGEAGTVTFNPGQTTQPVSVTVNGDTVPELDEKFVVNLSGPVSTTILDGQGQGTISNDDGSPQLSINDPAVTEGNSGTVDLTFTVTLAPASGAEVRVNYTTVQSTATAGSDYVTKTGVLTFGPGTATQPITIQINSDLLDEANETVFVDLSEPVNATIADSRGTGTITDDDAPPSVSITSVGAVTEGNASVFNVTLSAASGQQVTVQYSTTNGTATSPADYTSATNATLTFVPGDTSESINITTIDDTVDEPAAESFNVTLSAPTNVSIPPGQGTATGTINDNDDPPSLSISDGNGLEGNSGLPNCGSVPAPGTTSTGFAFFTVSLSAASGLPITVQWSTADNTAVAPDDYASVSPTPLTFSPGALSQPVCVRIAGDVSDEPNQTFNVLLTAPTNATINDGTGVGTILDDDGAPALTVTGANDPEGGGPARFVVSLLPASGIPVTVSVGTAPGSAGAGADYAPIPAGVSPSPPASCSANPCGLMFNPGQTSKAIDINIVDDPLDESDETFTVSLSNEQNAVILNGNDRFGIVTIVDNDAPPSVSIGDATVAEGNGGTVGASFPVTLSTTSGKTVSVNYAAANGTAVAPEDFAASSTTLTFAPGETSKIAVVPVNGDTAVEPDETFSVGLSSPVNVTIADGQAVGRIVNDDDSPPPPPPPPVQPPPPTTSTTTTGTGPATTIPPPPPPPPAPGPSRTFTGMGVSAAPVTLLDNLAPIRVTCSRRASRTCIGTVVLQSPARVLAIVRGQPLAKAVTLGREAFAIPRGRSEKVLVGLTKRALKAVKRAGKLRVTVVVTARDSAGKRAKTIRRALWLRTAKKAKKSSARR
jgi:hypothetical protein